MLKPPSYKTYVTLGELAFTASAPKLWNALSADICNAKNVDCFKRLLKSHVFIN